MSEAWSPTNRFRGRSVPSPKPRTEQQTETVYIERHVLSINLDSSHTPPNKVMVMLASSNIALDKIVIKRIDARQEAMPITIAAISPTNDVVSKVIPSPRQGQVTAMEGWQDIAFFVQQGEELWVQANENLNAIITMEFVKDGRTVDRVIPVPEPGPPA
jgi:hypothetical protein